MVISVRNSRRENRYWRENIRTERVPDLCPAPKPEDDCYTKDHQAIVRFGWVDLTFRPVWCVNNFHSRETGEGDRLLDDAKCGRDERLARYYRRQSGHHKHGPVDRSGYGFEECIMQIKRVLDQVGCLSCICEYQGRVHEEREGNLQVSAANRNEWFVENGQRKQTFVSLMSVTMR